jgi:phosphoribosylcarboxyaminoimidazole (NCAIR) mutase
LIQKNLHLGATLAVFDAAKTENAALLAAQTLSLAPFISAILSVSDS